MSLPYLTVVSPTESTDSAGKLYPSGRKARDMSQEKTNGGHKTGSGNFNPLANQTPAALDVRIGPAYLWNHGFSKACANLCRVSEHGIARCFNQSGALSNAHSSNECNRCILPAECLGQLASYTGDTPVYSKCR